MNCLFIWGFSIGVAIIGYAGCWAYCSEQVWNGFLWGATSSIIINVVAFIAVYRSLKKSFKKLLASMVLGIAIRMIAMGGLAVYMAKFTSLSVVAFMISFFAYFALYEFAEVGYLYTLKEKK